MHKQIPLSWPMPDMPLTLNKANLAALPGYLCRPEVLGRGPGGAHLRNPHAFVQSHYYQGAQN